MKRVLILVFVCSCFAGSAFAQAGSIGVFSEPTLCSCDFVDTGGLVQVYIAHVYTFGATASQFKLQPPSGWLHLGDTWNFPTVIGSSIAGVSVAYGGCLVSHIVLGTINFFGAAVPACTRIGIVADPASPSGMIEGVDCADPPAKMFPTGGEGYVNSDESCWCGGSPVEDTTWGGVKALYR